MSIQQNARTIEMQPLAMRIPNRHGILSVSKLRQRVTMRHCDLVQYSRRQIRVCLVNACAQADLLANAVTITAYASGLDCWYAKVSDIDALQNGAYLQESEPAIAVVSAEAPAYIDLSELPAFQYWQIDHELK